MGRKILALDIRKDRVSALLIRNSLKGNLIEAHTHILLKELPAQAEDPAAPLADALKSLTTEMNVSEAETVVSVSPDLISFRNLKTPFKDRKKIRKVLPFEMEPVLPYPIEEMTSDFLTIPHEDQTQVLAAAIETARLNQILDTLKSCAIDPRMVTGGGISSAVCLARLYTSTTDFFFIDLDGRNATIFVVLSGQVYVARCFQYASKDPVKSAQRIYQALLQMRASFESFFNLPFEPSAVLISEDNLGAESLAKEIERLLDLPVRPVNVLNDLDLNIKPPETEGFQPDRLNDVVSLAAIHILGIRTVNFRGERSALIKYWEEYKNDIVKTGSAAAFVFILFLFNVLTHAYFLQKKIDLLNRQIAFIFQSTFPDITKIVDPVQQMRIMIQQEREKNRFTGEQEGEKLNINMLYDMASLIPESLDVEITQFVRSEDAVLISGHTDTFNAVDEIKGRLEKAKSLGKITISSANQDKITNRIQFKLKVEL